MKLAARPTPQKSDSNPILHLIVAGIDFSISAGLSRRFWPIALRSNRRQPSASAEPGDEHRAQHNREGNPKQVVLERAAQGKRFSAGTAPAAGRTRRDQIGAIAGRSKAA